MITCFRAETHTLQTVHYVLNYTNQRGQVSLFVVHFTETPTHETSNVLKVWRKTINKVFLT